MPGRIIAIGDLHGCNAALEALIAAIAPTKEDTIVTLGDYIDRGDQSQQVIQTLIDLKQKTNLITLLGNHERMMLDAQEDPQAQSFWLQFGGAETVESYGTSIDDVPEHHWDFLRNCLPYYELEEFILVHACYDPELPLADQTEKVRIWQHLGVVPPEPHYSGKTVFVGHTPQSGGEVLDAGHLVGIDTYCFGGKYLTAINCETRQTWQADMLGRLRNTNV